MLLDLNIRSYFPFLDRPKSNTHAFQITITITSFYCNRKLHWILLKFFEPLNEYIKSKFVPFQSMKTFREVQV